MYLYLDTVRVMQFTEKFDFAKRSKVHAITQTRFTNTN
jgi:hypothetical protein